MEAVSEPNRKRKKPQNYLTVLLLLVALGLCGRLLLPDTVGEHVRRVSVDVLSDLYPNCTVRVGHGRYEPGKGLIISDIEVRDASLPASSLPLVSIKRVLVEASVDINKLKSGFKAVQAKRVILDAVTINAWPLDDSHWSPEMLIPNKKLGDGCPLVLVGGLRIRLCQTSNADGASLELNDIQLSLQQQVDGLGRKAHRLVANGKGGFLDEFQLEGIRDFAGNVRAHGLIKKASFDHRAYSRLPLALQGKLKEVANAAMLADVDWHVEGLPEKPLHKWEANVRLLEGRFSHERLPVTAEKLSGSVIVRNDGVKIQSITGQIGGSNCHVSGTVAGLDWPNDAKLRVRAERLMLSEPLLAILPEKPREVCEKIRPSGIIDFDGWLLHRNTKWDCDAVIECHDVSVNVDKFPYPIHGVRGTVRIKDKMTSAERLSCQLGQATIRTAFQFSPQDSGQPHWMEISSEQPVRIDETLIAALTPRGESTSGLEKFVRSLSPGGFVRLIGARLERDEGDHMSKQIDLEINDGRLRYDGFAYPLYEVRGRIWVDDQQVRLSQFQAQNTGGAQVQCEGNWIPNPQQSGGKLDLTFRAYSILLDDGLRAALPLAAKQTWDTLSPAGTLERLEVRVQHEPWMKVPELIVTAEQWGNPNLARKDLSVTPTALPYRLDISRGIIHMAGEKILISEIDGYHGQSRLTAEGQCIRRADGRWQLDLNLLTGSRIRPDQEFITALPDEIRGSFAKLQLREPVSLRGTTQLILPDLVNPLPIFSWNTLLQLEGNRIGDAGPVHDIRGEIAVRGTASGDSAVADGSIRIDSMHANELQLTNIQGPFVIRGTELRLGVPADAEDQAEVPIKGNLFGGDIRLVGDVQLSTGAFDVDIALERANLPTLLAEVGQPQSELKGLFGGKVKLEGNLGASSLLRGTGKAALTEASMYQLPVLVQVLNQMRLKPAEDVAFTDGTTNFSIDDDLLTLTDLNLWGDLVALSGGGTINGRRELDLAFNTRVSPQNAWSRLVRPLSSSKYALWTISVSGPLSQPKIEGRTLEAVGETLERLFPLSDSRFSDLPLATGEDLGSRSTERRPPVAKAGGSPWAR